MTFLRAPVGGRALAACVALWSTLLTAGVRAQDAPPDSGAEAGAIVHFDLAAQPLVDALHAYSRATDLSVMARTDLLGGLTSAPVEGDYPAREGLMRLLAGTGLQAVFPGVGEAVVRPLSPGVPAAAPIAGSSTFIPVADIDGIGDGNSNYLYTAMIQARVIEALCASASTRPGDYRLVVQLRIGNAGRVTASKLVGSAGSPARDEAIAQAVRALTVDTPPPAMLLQPVTILLRPETRGVSTDCARYDAGD